MTVRVFTNDPLAPDAEIVLEPEESHYLARVRRAGIGDTIEVLDGRGGVHVAWVVRLDARSARVRLGPAREISRPEPLELGLGLPEPSATLEAITHACEAGATVITLVRCERSHVAVPSSRRIDRVVRAALRQCGAPLPPRIREPIDLDDWLDQAASGLFAWAQKRGASTPLPSLEHLVRRVLVGPEGGLTAQEARRAELGGLLPIALGPWVLRTPTAVVAALTRLRFG
jgi:16S rRNA (uracil1498-N3)-methyltransferase